MTHPFHAITERFARSATRRAVLKPFSASVTAAVLLLTLAPSATAITINGGIGLLTPSGGAQLETWLGEGPLALTSIFSHQAGDGKRSLDFHAAVDGQGRTFVILEVVRVGSTPVNEIIGGYNPQSWRSVPAGYNQTPNLADRTAALFNLTDLVWSPQSSGANGVFQTYNSGGSGPVFGGGFDIYVDTALVGGQVNQVSYGVAGGPNILGNLSQQNVSFGRMEVFTLAPESISVPDGGSTLVLLGCALAGLGWAARRFRVLPLCCVLGLGLGFQAASAEEHPHHRERSDQPHVRFAASQTLSTNASIKEAKFELPPWPKNVSELKFSDFFVRPVGKRGLELTEQLRLLDGRRVRMLGYMVHQEEAPPGRFLFTPMPAQIHEHDNGLADDLPASTGYVFVPTLRDKPVPHAPGLMLLTGTLSLGNRAEPDGRISVVRLALDPPEAGGK